MKTKEMDLVQSDRRVFLFTSESVGEGHPDKICDQVSDAILDACLKVDPNTKSGIETAAKTGMILVFGELSTHANPDFQKIVRETIKDIGYDCSAKGFDYNTCNVLVAVEQQSPDIAQGLRSLSNEKEDIGAGDQGIMFGYATDETEECMPLTLMLAHKLVHRLSDLRKTQGVDWLLPDCKAQVTIEYELCNGATKPLRVHTIVISTQHTNKIGLQELRDFILEKVVKHVAPSHFLTPETLYYIQPTGKFLIGGPQGDAGLTGRKIIVDTYGGWGAHGGGAFSGKDWSKVDRSAAYGARWIAKSFVHAKICKRCLIQISYTIGRSEPLSIYVDTYGTSNYSNEKLLQIINKNFDLRPGVLVRDLELDKPIYLKTACFGHFGRSEFTWEIPKQLVID